MVVRARSDASIASVMQEQTGTSSTQTVQAEHEPRSQTTFVPVNPRSKRNASANVVRGSTFSFSSLPLTRSVMATASGPTTTGADATADPSCAPRRPESMMAAPAAVKPAPLRNPRRVTPCDLSFVPSLSTYFGISSAPMNFECDCLDRQITPGGREYQGKFYKIFSTEADYSVAD